MSRTFRACSSRMLQHRHRRHELPLWRDRLTSKFYAEWRDPWPKPETDFPDALSRGLWSLLEPSRLLDLIAHFIVFEKTETGTVKKMCRYQQFRAVNKIVEQSDREQAPARADLAHTGRGKSLTMVFAALKLKTHLTITRRELTNPNIMVLTDRVDLHSQISGTFAACGLPNPHCRRGHRRPAHADPQGHGRSYCAFDHLQVPRARRKQFPIRRTGS